VEFFCSFLRKKQAIGGRGGLLVFGWDGTISFQFRFLLGFTLAVSYGIRYNSLVIGAAIFAGWVLLERLYEVVCDYEKH
jgi:hypothetical protein